MVLTRQQARRDEQGSHDAEQTMVLRPSHECQQDGIGRDSSGSTSEPQLQTRSLPATGVPRESFSWSNGDQQSHASPNQPRIDQNVANAMKNMQDKVCSLENSLQSVTAELRGVLQSLSTSAVGQTRPVIQNRPENGSISNAHSRTRVTPQNRSRPMH